MILSAIRIAFLFLVTIVTAIDSFSQTTLKGTVKDERGEALPGANVFIEDSYDGATTNIEGAFTFKTTETGAKKLVISFVGYETQKTDITLAGGEQAFEIILKEAFTEVNTVVISAGGFGASDDKKAVLLNPLDIVTIAGANGDLFGALNYLPGTTPVGEENGIFVRGGDNSETQTVIDELPVQKPFFSNVPDIPSRSRFNPFTFKGTFFSTGGYSAQYGQAMSSSLILSTTDMPDTSSTGMNIMMVGGGFFHTKKWPTTSFSFGYNYTDVALAMLINKQAADWEIPPRGSNATVMFRHKSRNGGMWKFYSNLADNKFVVKYYDVFNPEASVRTKLHNYNIYNNASYRGLINDNWILFAGVSAAHDEDVILLDSNHVSRVDQLIQGKVMLVRSLKNNSNIRFGAESQLINLQRSYNEFNTFPLDPESYSAVFAEVENNFSTKFAARLGGRGEYSTRVGNMNVAPRVSLAYKTGKFSQASLASGLFYQTPDRQYFLTNESIGYEKATHFILNWQYIKDKRTFRAEAYYKLYDGLVRENVSSSALYENSGYGYSRGIDLFWRDQKSFKNSDYWFSYSFLDTKRLYKDYPIEAMPTFATPHTGSFVWKRFFAKIRSQIGFSYLFATGRPYFNPNRDSTEFLSDRAPAYHSMNVNYAYVKSIGKNFMVIFASLNNVLGRNNIFGYRFSADGQYSTPIVQPARRGFFIGMFIQFR